MGHSKATAVCDRSTAPPRPPLQRTGLTIFIRELTVDTVIGVDETERQNPRSLVLDLEIELWNNVASKTDQLADTVDYGAVIEAVRESLAATRYHLLERLAESVVTLVLRRFGAKRVKVSIAKTGIFAGVGHVGVKFEGGQI
jgi:dihydroneopterin aldolase